MFAGFPMIGFKKIIAKKRTWTIPRSNILPMPAQKGFPMIGFKKIIAKKRTWTIPRSNILPMPAQKTSKQKEVFEMKTLHCKPRVINVEPICVIDNIKVEDQSLASRNEETISTVKSTIESKNSPIMSFNTSRRNKNLISFTGMLILVLFFSLFGFVAIGSRLGWVSHADGHLTFFVLSCLIPVILPTIYFMRNPKHLMRVLKDLFL